jgi:hypothetical protein
VDKDGQRDMVALPACGDTPFARRINSRAGWGGIFPPGLQNGEKRTNSRNPQHG